MSPEIQVGIAKTPDQLRNQIRQVNIHRIAIAGKEPFSLPGPEQGTPEWTDYVSSLRGLRKFQREQLPNPQFYKLNYDPNLALSVLDHLHEEGCLREPRTMTERFPDIADNESTFISTLQAAIPNEPYLPARNFPLLENVLSHEELSNGIKQLLNETGDPFYIKLLFRDAGFETILKYVAKDDLRVTFQEIATGQRNIADERTRNSGFLDHIINIKELEELFTTDEMKNLAKTFIENNTDIYIQFQNGTVPLLVEKKILDQELLEKIVFQAIKGLNFVSTAFEVLPYTPNITEARLHDAFKQAFWATTDDHHIYTLFIAKNYLSEAELFEIAKSKLELNPNLSSMSAGSRFESLFSESSWYELMQVIANNPSLRDFDEARKFINYSNKLTPKQKYELFGQLYTHWKQSEKEFERSWYGRLENKEGQEIQKPFAEVSLYQDRLKQTIESFPEENRPEITEIILNSAFWGDTGSLFNSCAEFLDSETLVRLLNQWTAENPEGEKIGYVLRDFDGWNQKLSNGQLIAVLEKVATLIPDIYIHTPYYLTDALRRFPIKETTSLFEKVAFENPFVVIKLCAELREEDPEARFDYRNLAELGSSNKQKVEFAPKALKQLFQQLLTTENDKIRIGLAHEGYFIYEHIAAIQRAGFADAVKSILSKEQLSSKQELELLSIFNGYAKVKNKNPGIFEGIEINLKDLGFEEAKRLLFKLIDKNLDRNSETTDKQIKIFVETMGSPSPFLIYLAKFKGRETSNHLQLLKEIYESIINNSYQGWKYGSTEEFFAKLQKEQLLPESLTYTQYGIWQQDQQSDYYDTLFVDSAEVSRFINRYLKDNIEHLKISHVINSVAFSTDLDSYNDLLENVSERIRLAGQNLQSINLQLNEAKKRGDTNLMEEYKNKEEKERKDLIRTRNIIRLMMLTPQEILQKVLLEGKDKKQKGEPLVKLLGQLRETSDPNDRFVYDEVKKLLDQVHTEEEKAQNLHCTDSSDPKAMLEIGATPVSSCQHYDHGSYNSCLLGYSEPNTKILIVRNGNGSIIARSIFRLLASSDGQPTLHVERIYSSYASGSIPRIIYAHAVKKAQEMGINVVVSRKAQTEAGVEETMKSAEGFALKPVRYKLHSYKSRAPAVYVDSAGGANDGEYELVDLLEIRKAV